jgi:hypothetical protein
MDARIQQSVVASLSTRPAAVQAGPFVIGLEARAHRQLAGIVVMSTGLACGARLPELQSGRSGAIRRGRRAVPTPVATLRLVTGVWGEVGRGNGVLGRRRV